MAKVLEFKSKKQLEEEEIAHITGQVVCLECGHEWTGVMPAGTFDELQCEKCGLMKGVLNGLPVPESVWFCNCGCHLMVVSGVTKEILCVQCGLAQKFPE